MEMRERMYFVLFAVGLLTSSAIGQKAAAVKPDPSKEVRVAFERLADGIRQVDVEKVMDVYDKSDNILFFNNNGTVTRGWQTMKENRESSYAKTKNVSLEITGLRVEMLGANAAYVTCKWKQDQEYDGKLETASGRMSLVFRLVGKHWKAVHLHTSPDQPAPNRPVLESERIKVN